MKTALFFYTGTGNALWTARQLAQVLGNTEMFPMVQMNVDILHVQADAVGIVFPVHMWGVPRPVIDFINRLAPDKDKYYFALAVNAGQVSRTLIQLQELMRSKQLELSSGFGICLPSNYIPWGGPGPIEKQQILFENAKKKIMSIADIVSNQARRPLEKGPLWQRIIFTWFYKMAFPYVYKMDKNFWVDEKCNTCTICKKVCPAKNIEMQAGKPVWLHHCEQCLACIQWCPQKSIQYGKKTPAYERYHHPEVKVNDIIASAPK